MTAQHTPGPWFFCKQDDTDEDSEFFVMERNKYDWPNVVAETDREADACLIAAAPDLLEALQAAVECGMVPITSVSEGGASKHSRQVQVADMIRAAIARATHKEGA